MIMRDVPESFHSVGLVLAGIGGVGLVLTQGRKEKGIVAKGVTGLVSLYGVLGTYGVTAFIGDTLSYSRLLALGLTTSIVAMAFNEIASGFKAWGAVGLVLFALFALAGHTFNFAVSILSAFVHSARLIFLEFFGRFYEGGAKRFAPLGFNSLRIELIDE
jgi:V/A-type H+-transporting ATPase subunit I